MYVVHSTFKVPIEKVDEVISIYHNRSKLVDRSPGFVSFQLSHNQKRQDELTVQLTWDCKENYIKWVSGPDYKKIHDLEKKYPDQELANIIPKVDQFEVVGN